MSFAEVITEVTDNIRMEAAMITDGWKSLSSNERIGIALATVIPTIFFTTAIYAITPLVGR